MTRKKKSRKPGRGSSGIIKTDENSTFDVEKRIRKKTGNKPGSRQQVVVNKKTNSSQAKKDSRVGSKKPIALIKTPEKVTAKHKTSKSSPLPKVAAVTVAESADSKLWQELEQIEQNPDLLRIVEKMDLEQALEEHEVDLYNDLMARHAELSDQLGIDDEEQDEIDDDAPLSEDDLWNKFNDEDYDFEQ